MHADAEWGDDAWRTEYMKVDDATVDSLAAAGDARRTDQERARAEGRTRQS